jgi:hypothetical protein
MEADQQITQQFTTHSTQSVTPFKNESPSDDLKIVTPPRDVIIVSIKTDDND